MIKHRLGPTGPLPWRAGGLRFAFYGRISTPGYQDEKSSHQWQRENAVRLIAGTGMIVRDFFDAGRSRSLDWSHRPATRALLDLVTDSSRGFDAIVVVSTSEASPATNSCGCSPTSARTAWRCGSRSSAARSTPPTPPTGR
jgi:hypothetical protein